MWNIQFSNNKLLAKNNYTSYKKRYSGYTNKKNLLRQVPFPMLYLSERKQKKQRMKHYCNKSRGSGRTYE